MCPSAITTDLKKYYKLPAPNRMVGLTKYKDYKVLQLEMEAQFFRGDAGYFVPTVAQHRFERDGLIVMVLAHLHTRWLLPDSASAGIVTDALLVLNGAIPLARISGGVESDLATDTGYRNPQDNQNVMMPSLHIPVEEDDNLNFILSYIDLSVADSEIGSEARLNWNIHYIEL